MSLTFQKVDGVLPVGVSVEDNGRVKGLILFENIDLGPVWETEGGLLATVDEEDTIVLDPVVATPRDSAIECYSIVVKSTVKYNLLPWGLTLDPHTGVISGTLEGVTGSVDKFWYDGEEPQWDTASGTLGTFSENTSGVSVVVSATSPLDEDVIFRVVKGALPWGLTLDAFSGVISGNIPELMKKEYVDPNTIYNAPTWSTPEGTLGLVNESSSFSKTIVASPKNGKPLVYRVIRGSLPWGLTLNAVTGLISGTTSEVFNEELYDPEDMKPKIPTEFKYNSVNLPYDPEEVFVTVTPGTVVNLEIVASAYMGRTITSYQISNAISTENFNQMPFGLFMDRTTGTISGTINSEAAIGTYEFFISVIDSVGSKAVFPLKMVIEQGEE